MKTPYLVFMKEQFRGPSLLSLHPPGIITAHLKIPPATMDPFVVLSERTGELCNDMFTTQHSNCQWGKCECRKRGVKKSQNTGSKWDVRRGRMGVRRRLLNGGWVSLNGRKLKTESFFYWKESLHEEAVHILSVHLLNLKEICVRFLSLYNFF